MATEKEYDEEIAPMLKAVAERCAALGMPIVARVEFDGEDGEKACGITQIGNDDATVAQRLCHIAAHVGGNFDALAMECIKRLGPGNSIYLNR